MRFRSSKLRTGGALEEFGSGGEERFVDEKGCCVLARPDTNFQYRTVKAVECQQRESSQDLYTNPII